MITFWFSYQVSSTNTTVLESLLVHTWLRIVLTGPKPSTEERY